VRYVGAAVLVAVPLIALALFGPSDWAVPIWAMVGGLGVLVPVLWLAPSNMWEWSDDFVPSVERKGPFWSFVRLMNRGRGR